MEMLGLEYPDIYTYIKSLMKNIDECIDINIKKGDRTFLIDIIEYLGHDRKNIEKYNHELYKIIDLLIKEKGFKIKDEFEHYDKIELTQKDTANLTNISTELLKIMEVPYEEIESRYEESSKMFEIKEINLQSRLSKSSNEEKTPVFPNL